MTDALIQTIFFYWKDRHNRIEMIKRKLNVNRVQNPLINGAGRDNKKSTNRKNHLKLKGLMKPVGIVRDFAVPTILTTHSLCIPAPFDQGTNVQTT